MKINRGIFLALFLVIALLFMPNVANANVGDEIKVDGFKYQILTETEGDYTLKLIEYEGDLTEVEIPSTVTSGTNSYTVTSIAARAFWLNNEQVKKITIPSSITDIETMAFNGSTKLEEIIVDAGNTKFSSEDGVLFNYEKTKLVFYPEGKTNQTYTIPNTVTKIGESSFYRCQVIEKVIIPNTVTKIEDFAFQWCAKLKDVTIPNSVTSIGVRAFDVCKSIESIIIPDSVTEMGWGVFDSCENLKSVVISNSLNSIVERMFYACNKLNNVIIPETITSIEPYAFAFCYDLKNLTIPSSVMEVANTAFEGCTLDTKIYYVTNSLTNMSSSNTKNYVLANANYFTTTLTVNEGYKLPETINIKAGDKILETTNVYDASTGKVSIPTNLIDDNIEIIANGVKKIKVVLYSNGGNFKNNESSLIFEDWNNEEYEYDFENGQNNLEKPVREGYKFLGYFTKENGGTKIDNIMAEAGIDEDMIFYAQWEENSSEAEPPIQEEENQSGEDNNKGNENISNSTDISNDIDNNNTVTGNNPQTGDNIITFVVILGIAVIGIVITTTVKKNIKE